jgi:muramoyltetrapeptide carboxypeptidase
MMQLRKGIARLESHEFQVVLDPAEITSEGYLAGSDAQRIASFNGMLRRRDIKAIFAVRGGYGCLRILPFLDYDAARAHPKLLIGYSDVTALHMALYERSGWIGLQGPMVAVEWPEIDDGVEKAFLDLITGGGVGPLSNPNSERLLGIRSGTCNGVLLGGNLSVITALIGSPYLPSLNGAILYLEDVSEPPYRIDGYLAQLHLSGILGRLGGLIFGAFSEWKPDDDKPTLTYEQVISHYAQYVHGPVAGNLQFGHFPVKNTMPVGIQASLDVIDTEVELVFKERITS